MESKANYFFTALNYFFRFKIIGYFGKLESFVSKILHKIYILVRYRYIQCVWVRGKCAYMGRKNLGEIQPILTKNEK